MKAMRKFEFMALVLTLGALLTAPPILAGSGSKNVKNQSPISFGSIQLTNIGDEPAALGEASLRKVTCDVYVDRYYQTWWIYHGTLTIKCRNLIPGATYSTRVGNFTANSNGAGSISGEVGFTLGDWIPAGFPVEVEVVRLEGDSSSIPVLTGCFDSWPE